MLLKELYETHKHVHCMGRMQDFFEQVLYVVIIHLQRAFRVIIKVGGRQ